MNPQTIWIFNGSGAKFASGVFTDIIAAEAWISKHKLSGVLTQYPVDRAVYDWAIERGYFTPRKPEHHEPRFIGSFSSAAQEHFHYEGGMRLGE